MSHDHDRVLILDFGSQFTKLIARRIREERVYCEIHPPTRSLAWTLGPIPHLAPTVVPVSYLPVVDGPLQGNVDPETTAAFVQFAPAGIPGLPPSPGCELQGEGHYCAQTAPGARALRAAFYTSAVEGVPVVER